VAELEKIGGAICSAAPKAVVKACDYVLKDVTKIRTAIVNGITGDKFCENAGFCGSAAAAEVRATAGSAECKICQELFGAFKIAVRVSNASVAELEKIGGAICSAAPKAVVKACDYVLKDVTKIRTAIVNGITGDKFCENAGFCSDESISEEGNDCSTVLNSMCSSEHCKIGDLKCAVDCFEKHSEAMKELNCEIPKEAIELLSLAQSEPAQFAKVLRESPIAAIVNEKENFGYVFSSVRSQSNYPTVMAHGMGDSCFNGGMKQITEVVGQHTGSYSVCVPTGDNWLADTINGFLMNMDKSIDVFAAKIKADSKLSNGFNAIGFSQGNSLIRGYVQKYNGVNGYPTVNFVLHVHGTVSGVAGIPQCDLSSSFCRAVAHLCGKLSPNDLVQGILFQADYFRDPTLVNSTAYKQYSQLARMNNEGSSVDKSINENFGKTKKFVMVKALGDTMVYPNEGEWWGHFADGSDNYKHVLKMNETAWYKDDLFGLRTADQAGKLFFETTPGNHLQFTEKDLFGWIDKYFL